MNVLHVVHGYPPSRGGTQWLMKNLSEQLVTRHQDDVTVFTTVASNMELFWRSDVAALPAGTEEMNGVVVRRFPVFNRLNTLRMLTAALTYRLRLPYNDWWRTLYNGPLIFGMTQAIADSDADIVLATAFPLMHMYYALRGARRAGTPCVLLGAIHTADAWGYDRNMIYRAIERADAYIALTRYEHDHLVEHGIEAQKIAIIGPGVRVADFAEADGTLVRERYGWGDAPVVAAVGKQTARKRFDLLLQGMRQVWAERSDAHLVIAGARTSYSSRLEAMLTALPPNQRSNVTLVSDFPEKEKPNLLAAADLVAHPSGHESFGIVFIEAWASGTPVIGAEVGAIRSVISQGRDGLVFQYPDSSSLASAILELLNDPGKRSRMGDMGREKVLHNYSWEIVADRFREVYTELLSG